MESHLCPRSFLRILFRVQLSCSPSPRQEVPVAMGAGTSSFTSSAFVVLEAALLPWDPLVYSTPSSSGSLCRPARTERSWWSGRWRPYPGAPLSSCPWSPWLGSCTCGFAPAEQNFHQDQRENDETTEKSRKKEGNTNQFLFDAVFSGVNSSSHQIHWRQKRGDDWGQTRQQSHNQTGFCGKIVPSDLWIKTEQL